MFVRSYLLVGLCVFGLGSTALAARDLDDQEQEEAVLFLVGNTEFFLYHEFGHALISELDIPVLGREEDTVDNLAAVVMIPDEPDPISEDKMMAAIDNWFLTDAMATSDDESLPFWDEHGLDQQRGYQLACLYYGSDPEALTDLADSLDLPPERRESCQDDYAQALQSWSKVLEPHILADGQRFSHSIKVIYEPPPDELKDAADLLKITGSLESIAKDVATSFKLPHNLTLVARACGEPNAYWDPEKREVVMCYELTEFFVDLITQDILSR